MPAAVDVAELMAGMARRDPKSLEELYSRYSRALYNVIYSVVRRKEDAEEILCDVFQQAWEKAAAWDGTKGSVYTWLLTLSRNRAIDRLRSKGYKAQAHTPDGTDVVEDLSGSDGMTPLDELELTERAGMVRSALAKVSEDQRRVLEIAYFEGLSQSEIAERLEIPLGTVKSRVRDGMRALQDLLKGLV